MRLALNSASKRSMKRAKRRPGARLAHAPAEVAAQLRQALAERHRAVVLEYPAVPGLQVEQGAGQRHQQRLLALVGDVEAGRRQQRRGAGLRAHQRRQQAGLHQRGLAGAAGAEQQQQGQAARDLRLGGGGQAPGRFVTAVEYGGMAGVERQQAAERRTAFPARARRGLVDLEFDRRHGAVAALADGLDEDRGGGLVAQQPAQLRDVLVHRAVAMQGAAPASFQQLLGADGGAVGAAQGHQHVHRARLHLAHLVVVADGVGRRIDQPRAKAEARLFPASRGRGRGGDCGMAAGRLVESHSSLIAIINGSTLLSTSGNFFLLLVVRYA